MTSPTRERLRGGDREEVPEGDVVRLRAARRARPARASSARASKSVRRFDKADVILALDCDFLGYRRATSRRRAVQRAPHGGWAGREDEPALRGGEPLHGHRRHGRSSPARCRPARSALSPRARAAIGRRRRMRRSTRVAKGCEVPAAKFMPNGSRNPPRISSANKGKSLVLVGPRQPAAVQLLVARDQCRARQSRQDRRSARKAARAPRATHRASSRSDIDDEKIKTLFILGGNPAYNAPADLDWAAAAGKVADGRPPRLYEDETSQGSARPGTCRSRIISSAGATAAPGRQLRRRCSR